MRDVSNVSQLSVWTDAALLTQQLRADAGHAALQQLWQGALDEERHEHDRARIDAVLNYAMCAAPVGRGAPDVKMNVPVRVPPLLPFCAFHDG